jgi:hypothetical protein
MAETSEYDLLLSLRLSIKRAIFPLFISSFLSILITHILKSCLPLEASLIILKPLLPATLQTISSNMKFLPVLTIFFAGVLAVPTSHGGGGVVGGRSNVDVCPGTLYGQAQCCATSVADIADIDCSNRKQ